MRTLEQIRDGRWNAAKEYTLKENWPVFRPDYGICLNAHLAGAASNDADILERDAEIAKWKWEYENLYKYAGLEARLYAEEEQRKARALARLQNP